MASLMTLGLAADPLSFTSWPKEPLEPGKPVTLTWTGADPDQVRSDPDSSASIANLFLACDCHAP